MTDKLDRKTVEYLNEKITELHMHDYELFGVKNQYGKGVDMAYRSVARIFSDILSPIYYEENHRKRKNPDNHD